MIEWKLAIRPVSPTTVTSQKKKFFPYTDSTTAGIGLLSAARSEAPPAPPPTKNTSADSTSRIVIAYSEPRGRSRFGSFASSEASGVASIARKNQAANGSAAQMPEIPDGKALVALPSSPAGMLEKFDEFQSNTITTPQTTSVIIATMVTAATTPKTALTPRQFRYMKIPKKSSEIHSIGSMNHSFPRSSNGLGRSRM